MADETQNGAGDAAPEQSGGEAAVNALFSTDEAPKGGEGTADPGAEAAGGQGAEADDAWTPGYVPKAWRGEDGKFNGDMDAVFKSAMDGRQHISRLNAQIEELKQASNAGVPEQSQYVDGFDYAALAQKAPNMVAASGRDDNPVLVSFLESAHKNGIPMAKAHAMAVEYFEGLNAEAPEYKEPEQQRKDAIAYLGPNGAQMNEDIKGFLAARARHAPFSEDQMGVLKGMLHSGPGMSLLHNLARTTGASTVPPSAAAASTVDPEQERAEVMRDLGLPDHEFAQNKEAILARARRVLPNLDE